MQNGAAKHQVIAIAESGDTTIEITEYHLDGIFIDNPDAYNEETRKPVPTEKASFCVSREKLAAATRYFKSMFAKPWAEQHRDIISLKGDTIKSMEIWLRLFHLPPDSESSLLPVDDISIPDLWYTIMASNKYGFDRQRLTPWMGKWYSANQENIMADFKLRRETLYPCYAFNFAEGFQDLTASLAYGYVGHITERNPTSLHQMHLPPRVIQQLNAARGRLRNVLHLGLFTNDLTRLLAKEGGVSSSLRSQLRRGVTSDISTILKYATCECKEKTVFNYLRELQRVEIWPLEDTLKSSSIDDMIELSKGFDGSGIGPRSTLTVPGAEAADSTTDRPQPAPRRCRWCSQNWGDVVYNARVRVEQYFDGLCLDCMDHTKNIRLTRGGEDEDYWRHGWKCRNYSQNCRVSHGEPTWYFSFMGRRERRGQFD